MELNDKLYAIFAEKAKKVKVEVVSVGLGYTAVTTSDGGIGLSYTMFENKAGCKLVNEDADYEGQPAFGLLQKINVDNTIERSMALALVNALNYDTAVILPEDNDNHVLFDKLGVEEGKNLAMVGFFGPLLGRLKEKKVNIEVLDESRKLGNKSQFFQKLKSWADILLMTSTTLLNQTTEDILQETGSKVKTALLGPSTPMVAEAFKDIPVLVLAGTVPTNRDRVLKAIRHGKGTPMLQKYSRKSYYSFI